jgi:glycosyltransferase involved in cell wall biosynthesis
MLPLISCLMPTCDRREFIPQALACWQAQTYPNKELVIVDNGIDPIRDMVDGLPHVSYWHVGTEKLSTGEMRNRACSMATGTIFAHWDDDDYSHPKRLLEQHRLMISMSVSLVGYNAMYFIDQEQRQAWLYSNPEFYALGTSLMYTKDYWRAGRFPDLDVAEDSAFIERAQHRRAMSVRAADDRLIARIHSRNTCDKRKYILPPMWIEAPYKFVREMMP